MIEAKSPFLCLVQIHTPQGVQARLFDQTPFIIGREQTADLVIAHSSVSRKHLIVNFDESGIKIQDAGSANGTTCQTKKLQPQNELRIQPQDQIKLGLCEELLEFQIIPRPLELTDVKTQQEKLKASFYEVLQGLKNFARTEIKTELQAEIGLQKEMALQEILAVKEKSFADAEVHKQKLQIEYENRKMELENELEQTKKQFEQFNLEAKLSAEKKIQEWLRESQIRLQEDEAKAFEKQAARQRETQENIQAECREAQKKSDEILVHARQEAEKIRDLVQIDMQNIRKNALEQSEQIIARAQDDAHKISADIKALILTEAEGKAREKQQAIALEYKNQSQELESKLKVLEGTKLELAEKEKQLLEKRNQFSEIIQQAENAKMIIDKSLEEKKNIEIYTLQKIELEQAMKVQNEKLTLEFDERRRTLEKELSLLTANHEEGLKKQIHAEEQRIREVRKNQASEIARMIEIRMSDRAKAYIQDTNALSQFSHDLFAVARQVLSTEESSFQALTLHLNESKPDLITKNKKYFKPTVITLTTAMSLILFVFKTELYTYFKAEDQNSVAKQMIEQRKIQSLYNPEQNNVYRESYMENVLYLKHYSSIKTNSDYQQKWTLRLNDIALIRELKLTEDRMVHFQAIESNMVLKLTEMKTTLDAVYLSEGLGAMRKFEMEENKRLLEILKGQSNYDKIRQLEKEFIQTYRQAHSSEFP